MLASYTKSLRAAIAVLFFFALSLAAYGQASSAAIAGSVVDSTGAVVPGAKVEIHNPVSAFDRSTTTDASGSFIFPNVPFNPYHLSVTAAGFAPHAQDVEIRSSVPLNVKVNLSVAGSADTVTVEAGGDLVENDPTAHTDVDRGLFDKIPLESASSSVSSLVTLASPGVAADSNGLFHGLGDHASNSFSVDGQPITDQQSKVFSNQIPVDSIESLEVIPGAPPAEYGGKTSLVIVATTRSGQGVTTPHGAITTSYGSFRSANVGFNLAYGGAKWGNFVSAAGLNSGRFLDPPEFAVMHDKGNEENFFDRVDYQASTADSLHLNLGFSRSWFQTPNSYDSQDATPWSGVTVSNNGLDPNGNIVGPADQRSKIQTINIAPSWTRIINPETVLTVGAFVRRDAYNYYPSENPFADLGPQNLQQETISQNRTLANTGLRADITHAKGINNIKAGVTYQQTFLTENFNLGIIDPTLNAPCLDGNGVPVFVGNPGVNDPSHCANANSTNTALYPAPFVANPNFNPLLGCYDLTRAAPSPLDNCPNSTSGLYTFHGHTDVKELALYVQDAITKGNWAINLGLRADSYNGLTTAHQVEPRLGVAYNIKPSSTVLRVSYARTMESPFNENLILSSLGCADAVLNPLLGCTQSGVTPFNPSYRNEFHAGLQQAIGRFAVISGDYVWKYTHNAYDFSVLGATPITFPIEWHNSKIPGYAVRVSVPDFHGVTALVVFSSVAARFFTPQIGGAGAVPAVAASSGFVPFRIDHDEKFNQTTHLQYQPWKTAPWMGFNWRYDSGLVAGAVPFAADANGNVDLSGLTADQEFQAGLSCNGVRATPTLALPLSCAGNQFASNLVKIPAPGTENDDKNPPRIQPRNLFDIAVGHDNIFHGERFKWSARLTAVNITNNYALYNFLSTFSGTHYVTPRALTAEVGFHF
jgi:hypothetical protein